jgi:hypothetical protein
LIGQRKNTRDKFIRARLTQGTQRHRSVYRHAK